MKYKIVIDKDQQEDIIISSRDKTELLARIESMLGEYQDELFGYRDKEALRLIKEDVFCFYAEDGRVYAEVNEGKLLVKERLYRLEEMCSSDFVRVNQSCLVNISKIKKFSSSFGGSLRVELINGYRDYVSRRQLKEVKERIGLK